MKKLLLILFLMMPLSVSAKPIQFNKETVTFNPNKVCAKLMNIPYASDNFGYNEWHNFELCVAYLRYYDGY